LFVDVSKKLVEAWRVRAAKEYPANLERMKPPRRLTLLAALWHVRPTETTDLLVDVGKLPGFAACPRSHRRPWPAPDHGHRPTVRRAA
jgi:hypothetical protein